MKVVGLTGGIATGKSTVAGWLRDKGVPVVDADEIAREVVELGTPALGAIERAFGPEVLQPDGHLDRTAMRQRIANDASSREQLQNITHPAIFESIQNRLAELERAGEPIAVVEAALMFETGSHANYDEVMLVTCSPELQLERLLARDGADRKTSEALIAAQWPMERKVALATHVVRNDGTLSDLYEHASEVWGRVNPSSSASR